MHEVFKMPKPVKIMGRTSSITNAFVNGIIPVIEPDEKEIDEVLNTLGMTRDTICCAYCGDTCKAKLQIRMTGFDSKVL